MEKVQVLGRGKVADIDMVMCFWVLVDFIPGVILILTIIIDHIILAPSQT